MDYPKKYESEKYKLFIKEREQKDGYVVLLYMKQVENLTHKNKVELFKILDKDTSYEELIEKFNIQDGNIANEFNPDEKLISCEANIWNTEQKKNVLNLHKKLRMKIFHEYVEKNVKEIASDAMISKSILNNQTYILESAFNNEEFKKIESIMDKGIFVVGNDVYFLHGEGTINKNKSKEETVYFYCGNKVNKNEYDYLQETAKYEPERPNNS